jgi:copper chaperone CopZ
MMSMAELFYGENEPIWMIGNPSSRLHHPAPASPYCTQQQQRQVLRDLYVNHPASYADTTEYATSAYMQPAAAARTDHAGELVLHRAPHIDINCRHAQFNPYMQQPAAARDHDIRHYNTDISHPYMRSSSAPRHELMPLQPSNIYPDRRNFAVSPAYVQSAAACDADQVTSYAANRQLHQYAANPPYMPYYSENMSSWPPQQYPMQASRTAAPSSHLNAQQLPAALSNQTAASSPRFKNPPSLELKVPLCCQRCEERVKESLLDMDGVEGVLCDQSNQRVTVKGNVQPQRVLKRVKKIKKRSDFWMRSGDSRAVLQQQQQTPAFSYSPSSHSAIAQQSSATETY